MDWLLSEDSFFKHCARIETFGWGDLVDWPENTENPKLHHIRILKPEITPDQFKELCRIYKPLFESRKLTFSLKIPCSVSLAPEIMSELQLTGTPLCYLVLENGIQTSSVPSDAVELRQSKSLDDFYDWWLLYSTYPTREEKMKSPFMPYARKAFESGTQFYVLYKAGEAVAGLALDKFLNSNGKEVYNLWGVATRDDQQRQGLYKILESKVLAPLASALYMQVLENSPLYNYYLVQRKTARLLEVQARYVLR